jgi:hypothetical protein
MAREKLLNEISRYLKGDDRTFPMPMVRARMLDLNIGGGVIDAEIVTLKSEGMIEAVRGSILWQITDKGRRLFPIQEATS